MSKARLVIKLASTGDTKYDLKPIAGPRGAFYLRGHNKKPDAFVRKLARKQIT